MAHGDINQTQDLPLQIPDGPEVVTSNLLLLLEQTPNPRLRFLYKRLATHLHAFVTETKLSTDEWMDAIQFLTRVGKVSTPVHHEMILLSDVMGLSALVDYVNNPVAGIATENSPLGPFHTNDAPEIENGGSIASKDEGEKLYVEGRVLTTEGEPIADAIVGVWEADHAGLYDIQYPERPKPDYRGKLRAAKDGNFGFRCVIPPGYSLPEQGPVYEMLTSQGRHTMRPSHVHLMVEAPGYHMLVTSLYPDNDTFITSDTIFGVKKSLVVKLEQVDDEEEARKRGFSQGPFKVLKYDIVLLTQEQSRRMRQEITSEVEKFYLPAKDE